MSLFSEIELMEAARAITSALSKSEKAIVKLKEGSPQQRLTAENIFAFRIALALLRQEECAKEMPAFPPEELSRARAAFDSARLRVEKVLPKFAVGTPQHTLAVRRIRAFEIASHLMQAN